MYKVAQIFLSVFENIHQWETEDVKMNNGEHFIVQISVIKTFTETPEEN